MAQTRAHVAISGRVQGVCFRMYTDAQARALGLTGWVRNRYDGTVEAVFEGEEQDVDAMVQWCHHGPRLAHVARVAVTRGGAQGQMTGFSVRPSA